MTTKLTWMWTLWPAFLAAAALELLVFAFVDPSELHWLDDALGWSREGVYTAAFFAFWLIVTLACRVTVLLASPAQNLPISDSSQ